MEFLFYVVAVMLYSLISGGVILGLLVAADRHTFVEWPWVYILCGIAWPVAALPAAGYIAAGWILNKRNGGRKHGE